MIGDNGIRVCDVCGANIPRGTTYRHSTLGSEAAALFLSARDPDMVPTWVTNADGTIKMDSCPTCYTSMETKGQ